LSMRIRKAEVSFEDFVRARSGSLLRTAVLLAGQNRAEAEDLLQLAGVPALGARLPRGRA
jgi:hypothetical protein